MSTNMSANAAFHVAVLPGDGIGPEVMAPTLDILRHVEATTPGLKFRFTEAPAGANHYRETGKSMPESTIKLCEEADAILLGACGLPSVRYPDNTEIMPQVELRFIFDLYAGMRPARLIPGVPSPIVDAHEHGIDFVLIRESTEGLFASMGKGVVTHDDARETLVITRKTSQRLFDFSLRLAERRKKRGGKGLCTCVDKANAFKAYAYFRSIFDERAKNFTGIKTDRVYVDACAALMVRRPWDFDVMVMENIFGDILSDLAAGLIGGLGIAPSADIGDTHAVFQPCHGTAPDIMGQGKANPTAMILSAAMMLDWLADKHGLESAAEAGERIERAVDKAYADGINYYLYKNPRTRPALLKRFEPWFPLLFTDGGYTAMQTAGLTIDDIKRMYFLEGAPSSSLRNSLLPKAEPTGSNAFAIGPSKTKSKNALLYINPHVSFYFRTEMHMISEEGLNAYGAITWGQFFVFQGFNENCGWMHTSSLADAADLYQEDVIRRNDSIYYQYEGSLKKMTQRQLNLKYKKNNVIQSRKLILNYTHHGPVFGIRNEKWLSLQEKNRSLNGLIQSWMRIANGSMPG
jgi:3-isopropylmalate dehydrogenase